MLNTAKVFKIVPSLLPLFDVYRIMLSFASRVIQCTGYTQQTQVLPLGTTNSLEYYETLSRRNRNLRIGLS